MMKNKKNAFLIGPFIGELSWELYRFAPYIIFLKKNHPNVKTIVFTRPDRFDLYGVYADIFVPLRVSDDSIEKQNCFISKRFTLEEYRTLGQKIKNRYRDCYNIVDHIYPDISMFYSKLKWQFSRFDMDYDFKPRRENKKIAQMFTEKNCILVDSNIEKRKCLDDNEVVYLNDVTYHIENQLDFTKSTMVGCLIEMVKRSKCVISDFNSILFQISLLLKKPVLTINTTPSKDEIHLLNPFNTKVMKLENYKNENII